MSNRISKSEMALELQKLAYSKATWLSDFSHGRNKRPDHEIDTRRRELEVLTQAVEDYRRSSERDAA